MRPKIVELKEKLEKELTKLERHANANKAASDEIAQTATSSWSAGGDRFHSENQAIATAANLERMRNLLAEVEESLDDRGDVARPVAHVTVEFADDRKDSFYIVSEPVYLDGVKMVSTNAPLGAAIEGKSAGENVYFNNQVLQITEVL